MPMGPAHNCFNERNCDGESYHDFTVENADPVNDVIHPPVTSSTDGRGVGNRPPPHNAEAGDQSVESGSEGVGESNEDDDDLDVLSHDELDEVAAQNKEDWRIP